MTPGPANPSRKFRAFGSVTNATAAPIRNNTTDDATNGTEYFFSFAVRPGAMKPHS